MSAGGA